AVSQRAWAVAAFLTATARVGAALGSVHRGYGGDCPPTLPRHCPDTAQASGRHDSAPSFSAAFYLDLPCREQPLHGTLQHGGTQLSVLRLLFLDKHLGGVAALSLVAHPAPLKHELVKELQEHQLGGVRHLRKFGR